MTPHEQLDMSGGAIPLDELQLSGHVRALADAERERGHRLTADEAGALVHARRGKHRDDERCTFCAEDGTTVLIQLNTHRHKIAEREAAAQGPGWTCGGCGHENPGGAVFCRGCASTQDDDPEPPLHGYNHGNERS